MRASSPALSSNREFNTTISAFALNSSIKRSMTPCQKQSLCAYTLPSLRVGLKTIIGSLAPILFPQSAHSIPSVMRFGLSIPNVFMALSPNAARSLEIGSLYLLGSLIVHGALPSYGSLNLSVSIVRPGSLRFLSYQVYWLAHTRWYSRLI